MKYILLRDPTGRTVVYANERKIGDVINTIEAARVIAKHAADATVEVHEVPRNPDRPKARMGPKMLKLYGLPHLARDDRTVSSH